MIILYNININYLLAGIGNMFIEPEQEEKSEILELVNNRSRWPGLDQSRRAGTPANGDSG